MDIIFYTNESDAKVVNKKLANAITKSGFNLINGCSITKPTVTNLLNNVNINHNYCYIADFDRYFYIVDRGTKEFGLFYYELKCDVLMSFKEDILNSEGIVKRQEYSYNRFITDDEYIVQNYDRIQYRLFPNDCFNRITNPNILITNYV